MYIFRAYIVLISQACQHDSRLFFVAGKKLSETCCIVKNRSGQTATWEGDRICDRKREYVDEKREEAEDRTYNSAVITCTVSYSRWGDTRSISIQRISCRFVLRRRQWGRIAVVVVPLHVKAVTPKVAHCATETWDLLLCVYFEMII